MRKLAKVVRVDAVDPIAGADRLELATVGGWQCVVGKGVHKPGGWGVFLEIDSWLPASDPRWASYHARKATARHGVDGHRVKTTRLRGVLSQGILLTLDEAGLGQEVTAGDDVTEELGVLLWERTEAQEAANSTRVRAVGTFPTHLVAKTDAERVQNLDSGWLASLDPADWYATEKVDGTSLTVILPTPGLIPAMVCSRNNRVPLDTGLYGLAAQELLALLSHPGGPGAFAVQAEIVGPAIQGNGLKLAQKQVRVFSVSLNNKYLPRRDWPAGLPTVPVLDYVLPATRKAILAQADGLQSTITPGVQAEGIVWHHREGRTYPELNNRCCFKAINNTWLERER